MIKVKKHNLLLIASFVWLIAGFNILRIGIETYNGYTTLLNFSLSTIIFLMFWFMVFYKLTKKHTRRIHNYEIEEQFFLKFFDVKSFIIMAFMMALGIVIRTFSLMPDEWIAIFYTGLGAALSMAGALFGRNYFKYKPQKSTGGQWTMKKIMNTAIVYFILSMIGGVFYREFTKFNDFLGETTLKALHGHLLILGMFLFLFLAVVCKVTELEKEKSFQRFFLLYNIALPFMVIMMLIRGVIQVKNIILVRPWDSVISGFAGISHILMMISMILLLISLKKVLCKDK